MNALTKINLNPLLNKMTQRKDLIVSFFSILAGIISGSVIYNLPDYSVKSKLLSLFVSFNTQIDDKTFIEIFSGIFLSGAIYFIIMMLLGGNVFGKELSLIITIIKSSGLGALISYLYDNYAIEGLEYTLLIFIPGKIILIFSILFFTECCYNSSGKLRSGLSNGEANRFIKIYTLKSAVAFGIMLLSWLIDFLCLICFSELFSFT